MDTRSWRSDSFQSNVTMGTDFSMDMGSLDNVNVNDISMGEISGISAPNTNGKAPWILSPDMSDISSLHGSQVRGSRLEYYLI
jgi:hypothetical protein